MVALAERAIACKGWRWLPGVLTVDGWRVVDAYEDGTVRWVSDCGQMETRTPFGGALQSCPDLTDPATLGCLLALVRSAYGDDEIGIMSDAHYGEKGGKLSRDHRIKWWRVVSSGRHIIVTISSGSTEAEALVAALECAP